MNDLAILYLLIEEDAEIYLDESFED